MKLWLLATFSALAGIGAGVGMTIAEFSGVRETFIERAAKVAPAATGDKVPVATIVGTNDFFFGATDIGITSHHDFVVKNTGLGVLTLKSKGTSCDCTQVKKVPAEQLQPGEETVVGLEWKPFKYADSFRQAAEIETNDPEHPMLRFEIHGVVRAAVQKVPERLVLSNISAREETTATVKVYGFNNEPLEIRKASLVDPEQADKFELSVAPLPPAEFDSKQNAKSGQIVTIKAKSGLPTGELTQTIRLETNVPSVPTVDIPVHVTVVGDITVRSITPGVELAEQTHVLRIGTVPSAQGKLVKLYITVRGQHRHETKLEVATVEPATALQARLLPTPSEKEDAAVRYPLEIEIPPGAPSINRIGTKPEELGVVVLKTTHPTDKEVRLYVRFAVE